MASVRSLDRDLRDMRLSKYSPQAANEVREWIEEMLNEKLAPGDLINALKDGVALCKLVNLIVSPPVKYKQSNMPFVQMENISHFLHACQNPPLSLPPHDVFLTVDLYEKKDPAQVLQCLGAFSRRANDIDPKKFPRSIGGFKSKSEVLSPQGTGASNGSETSSTSGGATPSRSPASKPVAVSSWSKKNDETTTAPAWNIHQYGYMGGASQGNQGITFGARRQITSPAPEVPSLAEKERRRREAEAEKERQRKEEEARKQKEREEDEKRAKAEEERRWAEETERLREKERREVEEEKKRWDEEKRRWEEEEQRRLREEKEAEERHERERQRKRTTSDARLNGQFLSQYQASQKAADAQSAEAQRIKELERELALAKERERQYERERQELLARERARSRSRSRSRTRPVQPSYDLSSQEAERKLLRSEWQKQQNGAADTADTHPPPTPPRPTAQTSTTSPSRPLPDPTRAGGLASKTLLEREMERERERQREWEESQKQTQEAAKRGLKDNIGTGPGEGAWNVHQYGYLGGDNQNRGGPGLGVGGARRQIVGTRPPP
ncbi:hypothetical protein VTN77DRAFT_3909 [Rasamsonia byssochlamydoides]|uniref:uncharacterized protein n=1 Tax=Rasamsonia byssochlamydoides TaxID=89139 RepID=UPI003742BF2C